MGAPRPAAHGDLCSLDSRLATGTNGKLARHVGCYLSGIHADLMQEPGERYAHSDEMQAGLRAWNTVLSDRGEVAKSGLSPGW